MLKEKASRQGQMICNHVDQVDSFGDDERWVQDERNMKEYKY
jgi:hypothetical protein